MKQIRTNEKWIIPFTQGEETHENQFMVIEDRQHIPLGRSMGLVTKNA